MTKRGYCANKSMVQQQSSRTKCMPKHGPQGLQNPARHVPEPSKIEAWSAPGSQNVPKIHPRPTKRRPRAPKKRPRCAQGAPKRGQKPPKSSLKLAKWRPRSAQHAPISIQNPIGRPPKRICSAILVGGAVRNAIGTMLRRFLCTQKARDM